MPYPLAPHNSKLDMQIGDMKGFFGLITVNLQLLRTKLKVLDVTYGNGTGGWVVVLSYHMALALSMSISCFFPRNSQLEISKYEDIAF